MRNLMIGSVLVVLLAAIGCKRERLNEPGQTTTTGADIPQVEHNVPPAPAMIPPSPAPSPAAEPMIDLDAEDIAGAGPTSTARPDPPSPSRSDTPSTSTTRSDPIDRASGKGSSFESSGGSQDLFELKPQSARDGGR